MTGCCRWSLLFLVGFIILQLQLHPAKADPLQTLKRYSACISPCFPACDPNYDAQCVCNLLIQDSDSVDAAVACFGRYCNPDFATAIFPDFGRECSVFLGKPVVYNGTAIKTVSASSATTVETTTLTSSTYIPELTPTATSTSDYNTTSTALSSPVQTGSTESGSQGTNPETAAKGSTPRPVVAVYVLVPIAVVVLLVAIFFIWRRRKHQQQSIITAPAWDSSQNPIIGEAVNPRGTGGFTIRIVPRSISQMGGRTPSPRPAYPPPAYPPPARQPSIGRRARDFARRLMDKELPGLPLSLSITTISEVEETQPKPLPERDARTHRTTDSEDELRRVYREVRKGFRSESTASSAITSLDWSMMGGTSQGPDMKEPYV